MVRRYSRTKEKSTIVLDAIEEHYFMQYHLIREIGPCANGRYDGLLIPVHRDAPCMKVSRNKKKEYVSFFDRCRLVGVEVKVSRQDFLKGLNSGQFERYDEKVSGLYIATPRGVCKTNEIPEGIGHLVIVNKRFLDAEDVIDKIYSDHKCVCKRNPKYKDVRVDPETLWRLMFRMRQDHVRKMNELQQEYREKFQAMGHKLERLIFNPVNKIFNQTLTKIGE